MKGIKHKLKNIMLCLMSVMMIFTSIPVPAYAAGNSDVKVTDKDSMNPTGINFSIAWKEIDQPLLRWDETASTGKAVTMLVSYSCKKVRSEGYQPGDLIITLNGIGSANRGGALEALVGADKSGSAVKNRDWTYTYDRIKDTYTLINNKAIEGGSVFTGYFELIWSLNSRSTVHEFNKDVNASLYLPYEDGTATINSNTLNFQTSMKKDTYSVNITAQKLESAEGLETKLPSGVTSDDFYFVKYYITGQKNMYARGISKGEYIDITFNDDMVLLNSNKSYTKINDGTNSYRFSAAYGSGGLTTSGNPFYIYAAYKKEDYGTTSTADISAKVYGTFYEEDTEVFLAEDDLTINVAEFNFSDYPGDIYDIWKSGSGHYVGTMNDGCYSTGYLNGGAMNNGETANFVLYTTIHNPETMIGPGQEWNMEYVDDWLYIMRNDGTYRKLSYEEYEFTSITIPSVTSLKNWNGFSIASGSYEYIVYASTGEGYNDRQEVSRGYLDNTSHTVKLPSGTNLYSVRINHLKEGIVSLPIRCSVKFHISDTETEEERKDDLEHGYLVNTCFMRLYDNANNLINTWPSPDYYTDKSMAADDMRAYGMYLDREKAQLHIHKRYSDFNNSTYMSSFSEEKRGFTTTVTNTTTFSYLEDATVSKVSSYLLLPQGLTTMPEVTFPEAIWDYVTISGLGKDAEYLANHCTIEYTKDYKGSGRTYVAFHFDFSDAPIKPDSSLTTSMKAFLSQDAYKDCGSTYNVYGISMVDDDSVVINPVFHKLDNGSWINPNSLGADIDGDGNTTELISVKNAYASIIHASSSQLSLNKWVETTYTNGLYVQDVDVDKDGVETGDHAPYEELSGNYQYKLKLANGNNVSKDIVITDILENGPNSKWKGTLQSVDTTQAQSLGFNPVVRYAKTTTPSENDWTDDITGAKAVRIDLSDGELKEGQELYVTLNMKAPAGLENVGLLTENNYKTSFEMVDSASGESTKLDELTSNYVQVKLSKPRYNLIVDKKDSVTGDVLAGAEFSLIAQDGTVAAQGTTNAKGRVIFRDIEEGIYIFREITAPVGYETMEDVNINITGDGDHKVLYYAAEDIRKKGAVVLTKHNNLDYSITVPDAVYTLYSATDDSVVKDDLVTDENGQIKVTDLEWGSYYFLEKSSPEGYELSEEKILFTVSRQNVDTDVRVSARDPQMPASISLLKYEELEDGTQTQTPLQGAFFTLYKDLGDDFPLEEIGTYGTDKDGSINITDLAYGNYILKELKSPNGYEMVEDIHITVDAENRSISLVVYDKRMAGKLQIIKNDKEGHVLKDVKFTLYDSEGEIYQEADTDENGTVTIENLPWGDYSLVETQAPTGYELDKEEHPVTIGPGSLTVRVTVTDERILGNVRLIKTDESGQNRLQGAEYSLYKNDGTLVKGGLITNEAGEILVTDLDWATYYFKEDKAPNGYGISGELIRFSVNATNAGETLEVEATDPIQTKNLTLTKKILKDDIYFEHGVPTFLFTVRGTDVNGDEHAWNQIVSFTESSLSAVDENGYVKQSVTFTGIPAGSYTAFESTVSRYDFDRIENVSANGTINYQTVVFDLEGYDDGQATFVNDKKEWQDFSDSSSITNMIKASRKLVGLKVVYNGPSTLDSGTELTQHLTVSALYDDGDAVVLSTDEYSLSTPVAPYQSGDYTVTVSYTESGVTKRGTFTFFINYRDGMHPEIVSMTLEAAAGNSLAYGPGGAIDKANLVCKVKYNTGDVKTLNPAEYSLNYTIAPDDTGTYALKASYAEYGTTYSSNELPFKVKQLHLNDYSWSEIQKIIASGQGPTKFAECYEHGCAKEIPLSAGTARVAFNSSITAIAEQKIYVNILAFNHDTPTDGNGGNTATFGMAAVKKVTDSDGNVNYQANQTTTSTSGLMGSKPGNMNEYVQMETRNCNYNGATVMTSFLEDVYDQCMPDDLKAVIVPVDKKTSAGQYSSEIITSSNKLFLFSEVELFGQYYKNADGTVTEQGNNRGTSQTAYGFLGSFEGEGYQYSYYSDVNDPTDLRQLKYRLSRNYYWWERSPYAGNSYYFAYVSAYGYANNYNSATNAYGVSFGFCVR